MSSSAAAGNILTKYLWSRKPHTVSVCTCDSQLACPFEMWVKHTCCCWPFNSWSVSSASFLSPSHLPELAQTCLLSGQFVWKFKLGVHQVITVPCLLDSGVPRPFGFLSSAWHISLASALDLISSVGCKSLAEFPLCWLGANGSERITVWKITVSQLSYTQTGSSTAPSEERTLQCELTC